MVATTTTDLPAAAGLGATGRAASGRVGAAGGLGAEARRPDTLCSSSLDAGDCINCSNSDADAESSRRRPTSPEAFTAAGNAS